MAKRAPLQRRQSDSSQPDRKASPRATRSSPVPSRAPAAPFGSVVQTKMTVGPSHDRFEAEADRAADRVMGDGPGVPTISRLTTPPAQRKPSGKTAAKPDEEDKVQRKTAKPGGVSKSDDEEPVQRKTAKPGGVSKSDDEEPVQRKTAKPGGVSKTDDEEPVQRDAAGSTASTAPAGVEAGIQSARGGGRPLAPSTRTQMESGFGRSFGGVRIHDDARAARLNDSINARAFTTGSDIFFGRGAYNENSAGGQRLLAHELTHVVQQDSPGRIQAKAIQREDTGNAPADGTNDVDEPKPRIWKPRPNSRSGINLDGPHDQVLYMLPELKVPTLSRRKKGVTAVGSISGGLGGVAGEFVPGSNFHWQGKGSRSVTDEEDNTDNSTQVQIWERHVKGNSQIAEKVTDKFKNDRTKYTRGPDGPRVYYLQHENQRIRSFTVIGTADEIARNPAVLRPPYGPRSDKTQFMQVDHYIEIQLGGMHTIENMWLLDADANQKSGRDIKNKVVADLNELVSDAAKDDFWNDTNPSRPPPLTSWPTTGHIEFAQVKGFSLPSAAWDKQDIAEGEHLDKLVSLTPRQMRAAGLGLEPGDQPAALSIFLSKDSAFRRVMKVEGGELKYRGRGSARDFIRGFDLESATFHQLDAASMEDDAVIGTITGRAFGKRTVQGPDGEKKKLVEAPNLAIPVLLRTQHGYESYIKRSYINEALTAAALTGASPVAFDQVGLTDNWELLARGTVAADNPLFAGFTFGITLTGDSVSLDVTIPLDKLSFGPFKPTEATLSLGIDDDGLFYAGTAAFELEGVGSGNLEADKQKLAGDFNFDIDAFDPASVGITYENGAWSGEGELGVKPGTIPFVESALINVRVDENGFSLVGTATLGGPGIPAGTTLDVLYDQNTGELQFGADIVFDTAGIKGLSSARAALKLTRSSEGAWSISGGGAAAISLPYVTGEAAAVYEDGYLDVGGKANINRPPMTGEAEFHLSNRPVDAEGQPIDGPPLPTFRVWGTGTASVTFGDYITGTIGVAFLENGEIELVGTVALPPSIPLIEPTVYPYDILDFPEVRVPIIGLTIPVIRKSFGVFAFIGGGIDASVTVGPGELVDTEVTVNFNPDRPEEMSITGGSTFQMAAGAEVGLTVTGGIGAGLGIVEATGEVGLRGALGLELLGGGSVLVNWTPADGLDIDATVFGEATPKFRLSVVAGAKVVVDAFLWSGTLWSKSWERTLAEIGPDMTWRAELPASWSERDGLDLDINNLEITQPDINLLEFGTEIFEALTG